MSKNNWPDPEFMASNAYKREDGAVSEFVWQLLSFFASDPDTQRAYLMRGDCKFIFFSSNGIEVQPDSQANYLYGLSRIFIELHRFLSSDFKLPADSSVDQLAELLEKFSWMDTEVWKDSAMTTSESWRQARSLAIVGLREIDLPLTMPTNQIRVEDYLDPPNDPLAEAI